MQAKVAYRSMKYFLSHRHVSLTLKCRVYNVSMKAVFLSAEHALIQDKDVRLPCSTIIVSEECLLIDYFQTLIIT